MKVSLKTQIFLISLLTLPATISLNEMIQKDGESYPALFVFIISIGWLVNVSLTTILRVIWERR